MSGERYLPFVVALHVGTALTLLIYFLGGRIRLFSGAYGSLIGRPNKDGRLFGRLVLAAIPPGLWASCSGIPWPRSSPCRFSQASC